VALDNRSDLTARRAESATASKSVWHLARRGAQDAAGSLARGLRLASAGLALLAAALVPPIAVVIVRWAHLAQAPGLVTAACTGSSHRCGTNGSQAQIA
jgi:hypothetical protein